MALSEAIFTNPKFIPPIRFPNGNSINLITVREDIQHQAEEKGIPLAFREEQVKVGGLFSSQREDILIMYHPQHESDYLRFPIRITHQGQYAFMHIFQMGSSKNIYNANAAASGSMIKKLSNAIGGNSQKLQMEKEYYAILEDCINTAFQVQYS